jgi:hypothetical protein
MEKDNKKCNCGKCPQCKGKRSKALLNIGVWLLFLGVFFLASNFGLFQYTDFSKVWPVFLIIPGIIFIMRGLSKNSNA